MRELWLCPSTDHGISEAVASVSVRQSTRMPRVSLYIYIG